MIHQLEKGRGSGQNSFGIKAFGAVVLDVPLQLGNGGLLHLTHPPLVTPMPNQPARASKDVSHVEHPTKPVVNHFTLKRRQTGQILNHDGSNFR